jgi:glycosyltransferase involved in cell wall biosynthesis
MERMLASSAEIWLTKNWKLVIVSLAKKSDYQKELELLGYKIYNIDNPWTFSGLVTFSNLIGMIKPQALHNHVERRHSIISLIAAMRLRKTVFVRTIHNVFDYHGIRFIIRKVQNWIEKLARFHLVVPSSDVQLWESGRWNRPTKLIENWAWHSSKLPSEKDGNLEIVVLGNCSEIKNHELAFELIDTFCKTNKGSINLILHHIGNEVNATDAEKFFLHSDCNSFHLKRHGSLENPVDLLKTADLLLVTSLREGQSVAMIEALIMNIPCFAIEAPGLLWTSDIDSVYIAKNDSSLSEKFSSYLTAINDRPDRDVEKLVTRFSPVRGVEDYVNYYETLRKSINDSANY